MKVIDFLLAIGADFYTGVPDSLLKPLCDYLYESYGISDKHVVAANEGNAVGIAAGYHLATGKLPLVYMQNSGIGNAINPIASLLDKRVYKIPCAFVVGWRGEPGVHDEPQHIFQGEITNLLLDDLQIPRLIITAETSVNELQSFVSSLDRELPFALVVKKGALEYSGTAKYHGNGEMKRETIISRIIAVSGSDTIVSTTGKASRELFELREQNGQTHDTDFLTVGSMGHSSSIALGIALSKPDERIWCIDGDGAAIMHLGAMAVISKSHPRHYIHIVINNTAHETVGGMPTAATTIDLPMVARACGYDSYERCANIEQLDKALKLAASTEGLHFIEALSDIGSRPDLGRPTKSAIENKLDFMQRF